MILSSRDCISLLAGIGRHWRCQTTRGLFYSSKKGVDRNIIAKLQQPIDLSLPSILRWLKRRAWKGLVNDHSFVPERHQTLGPDLAAAHFIVARNGAVKFDGFNRWIKKDNTSGKYALPLAASESIRLEAIDASDTQLMYVSFDNLVKLHQLKYLSVAGCPNIDDWCLDRLVQFQDTLLVLDISRCPRITERGLATLHKLHRLRRLRMYEMPAVKHVRLTALLLEETLPAGCVVEGTDYSDLHSEEENLADTTPSFLRNYEELALAQEKEREKAIEQDELESGHVESLNDKQETKRREAG